MTRDSTPSADGAGRASEVIAEYLAALDRGEAPDRQEFLRAHADVARELEAFFADQERVEHLAQSVSGPPAFPPASATESIPATAQLPAPGQEKWSFADYEVEEELGRGGMGVVYRAWQRSLGRPVALKLILSGAFASPAESQRFRREAELLAQLDHPHVVPIYEVGAHEGHAYLSMKLIEGESLAQALAGGRCRLGGKEGQRRAARMVSAVARTVHYVHQRGVLHRDLKPANVLLDREGRPHVTDFGLARRLTSGTRLTQTGARLGTPSYMAPEQASDGKNVTTAADVYGLGAILYELLTGRPPFQGDSPLDVLQQVREQEPPRPRRLDRRIDRDLEAVCLKCLEKEPARRYGSAEVLAEDLERWLHGKPTQGRPMGRLRRLARQARRRPAVTALLGLALVLLLAGGSATFWQRYADAQARRELESMVEKERQRRAYLFAVRAAASEFEPKPAPDWVFQGGKPTPRNPERARALLDSCPRELRALEWYCIHGLCNGVRERDLKRWEPLGWNMRPLPGPEARGDGKHWQPYDFVIGKKPFVALSPDGKSMAAPSRDSLSILDLSSGKERLRLPPPVFGQWCFRPTRALYPWELDHRKWTEHTVKQASEFLGSVAFGPDGKSLYVAAEDGVRVLDATTGSEIRRLVRVPVPEFFSPDGKRFFSKNYILIYDKQHSLPNRLPKSVLYDEPTGREQFDLQHRVFLCFSRDGRRFAACLETGNEVTVHDSATCEKIITLPLGGVGFPTRDGTLSYFRNSRLLSYSEPWYYESLNLSIYLVEGNGLTWYGSGSLRRQYICDLTPPRD